MATVDKKLSCKKCGLGGMKCYCCGPAPGKTRKAFNRRVKRGPVKENTRKEIEEQLKEKE